MVPAIRLRISRRDAGGARHICSECSSRLRARRRLEHACVDSSYVGGPSALLLGTVSVAVGAHMKPSFRHQQLVMAVSRTDCQFGDPWSTRVWALFWLVGTARETALEVAGGWRSNPKCQFPFSSALRVRPRLILASRLHRYPPASSRFGFDERFTARAGDLFVDRLTLFKIGFQLGGVTSRAGVPIDLDRPGRLSTAGQAVRLNVGGVWVTRGGLE